MRWLMMVMFLLLPLCAAVAQGDPASAPATEPAPDPAQLVEDARVLYVARSLKLRADQVQKIIPLLNQAQERIAQRKLTLDDLWAKRQASLIAVDQALVAGQEPDRAMQNAVEKLIADYNGACQDADRDLEGLAGKVLAALDTQQAGRVERPAPTGDQPDEISGLIDEIGAYATAMRELLAEEYDTLRVPVALRLAGRLLAPDGPGFNNAVGAVLRLMDAVRQRSDAQFAQDQANMRAIVARALGLPEQPPPATFDVSFTDLMAFVSSPRTARLLATYKPEPAMEVVP